ncbi:hypothetical protein [Pediococcus acidilactici]|uniref:hypothetical protein n=1 Tax=Pediococcus acidilactici TaxID=1254 RepID=UPI001952039C|nr:hypothetical protein [Pediococcus acidilactici]MBM6644313.1 hypothetical protein [Pediococcus acidilactici]
MGIENVQKIANVLDHHVGSGGKAHLPATEKSNGFATPELVNDAKMGAGKRQGKPAGTDVLMLEPGKYEISGAKNNPYGDGNAALIEYDISGSTDNSGRRQIRAITSVNGDIWYRTVHTGGDPTTGTEGWGKEAILTPIWQGNANAGTITFNRPLPFYKNGIEVFYRTLSNQCGSIRIMHSNTASVSIPNNPDDQTDKTFQSYELTFKYDQNSLTITRTGVKIISEGTISNTGTQGISLTDVYAF